MLPPMLPIFRHAILCHMMPLLIYFFILPPLLFHCHLRLISLPFSADIAAAYYFRYADYYLFS